VDSSSKSRARNESALGERRDESLGLSLIAVDPAPEPFKCPGCDCEHYARLS
jgi:hypothetical protein